MDSETCLDCLDSPDSPEVLGTGTPPGGRRAPGGSVAGTNRKHPAPGSKCPRHTFEQRRLAVRLRHEEGFSLDRVACETGMGRDAIVKWSRRYREQGESGLRTRPASPRRPKLPSAVSEKIVAVRTAHPTFGVQRIADVMKRWFCLPASAETVRRTLHRAELLKPQPARKVPHNPARPRFFERATPNQLWQTDIFTFRLAGRQAYLIGFMDDYSRYLVGLELFWSQTAANVLELYRRAVAEYGVPKEMLTDNGRQYTNWRGTTAFEKELAKDRVKHIRSRPHHPMTLGKIERFWKSIHEEFLVRAQFDDVDEARARIALWVKYYNHRRPHQGIGGLCPADRFFEIQNELKKVLQRGIDENILEMALRGRPQDPFYVVGRMNGQSVVMQAEKGKLVMTVNGNGEPVPAREFVYDFTKEAGHEREDGSGDQRLSRDERKPEEGTHLATPEAQGAGSVRAPGGDHAGPCRTEHGGGRGPGARDLPQDLLRVGGPGAGGSDRSVAGPTTGPARQAG